MTWFACLLVKKVVCKKHWPDDVIEPYTHTHTHTQVQLCSCWLPKTMSSPWRPGRQDELFGAELCGQHGRRPAALDHNKCLVLFQPSSCKLTPRLQAETPSWHAHHFLFNLLHHIQQQLTVHTPPCPFQPRSIRSHSPRCSSSHLSHLSHLSSWKQQMSDKN